MRTGRGGVMKSDTRVGGLSSAAAKVSLARGSRPGWAGAAPDVLPRSDVVFPGSVCVPAAQKD